MSAPAVYPVGKQFTTPHAYAGAVTSARVVTRYVMLRRGVYGRRSPVYRRCTQWRVRIATDSGLVIGGFIGGIDGSALPTLRVGDRVQLEPIVLGPRYSDGAYPRAACHHTLRGKILRNSSNVG